ncbi:metal dependent phosphohydrolase [Sulfuricella denitrificans skB26]|uniref:Metal dependent phosphohydrolase n=1 Tax=Sulfuricella denitrificans (strain DSM 22764 / NBRC 105220 / skB26) TaxID=1163617 RepID=S6AAM9_SULDS|nr:HDOD domain-containing protein [Sulfuricella denitrificans]BAN36100.1 metal dependent phosphohydrolase [Sulfuricella denitrificans skB26]
MLTLDQVTRTIQQVPSLSVVVMETLASFDMPHFETADLAKKLNQDQGLTARVLRVANSPFYGMSSKVGSVQEAVVVLGFHNVRSLVAAAGIISQFPETGLPGFDRTGFWQHGIGTAACAQVLAKSLGQNQALAFTAGLLHDIGKLALDAYFHDDFQLALAHSADEDITLLNAESITLGVDHTQVGHELARRWKFPAVIQLAIRDHHQPERESGTLTDLVHVANVLCHALDIGNAGYDLIPHLSSSAWSRLGLDWKTMPALWTETEQQYVGLSLLISD